HSPSRQCTSAWQRQQRRARNRRQDARPRQSHWRNLGGSAMTEAEKLGNTQAHLNRILSDLQTHREQWGEIEGIDQARAAVKAKLDAATEELKVRRGGVAEVRFQHDKILKDAREELAKNERLKAENKRLTAANAALDADIKTSSGKVTQAVKAF